MFKSADLTFESLQSTPVHLIHKPTGQEVVKFPEGLEGKAKFSEDYEYLQLIYETTGICVSFDNRKKYSILKNRLSYNIFLKDTDFGRVFFEDGLRTLPEHSLGNYCWRRL